MLNDANLGNTTLSSAETQLINAAQNRQVGVTSNYTLEDQDCDNIKSIRTSIEECLQIFQVALNKRDNLTLLSAKNTVILKLRFEF